MGSHRKRWIAAACTAVLAITGVEAAWAANPGSSTTTTGQKLSIAIDEPTDGASVARDVTVAGRARIGTLSLDVNVVHVMDVSGSTGSFGNDCNGDGVVDSTVGGGDDFTDSGGGSQVIDCEIAGVIAFNQSLAGLSGVDTGLVPFASFAAARDVDPAAPGIQEFTTPAADTDGNGTADIEQAARALSPGGGTSFDPALREMNRLFATQPAGETNIGIFLSDGFGSLSTGAGSPVQQAVDAGTAVHTFSVGSSAAGCAPGSPLRAIADLTGGTCTEVDDPGELASVMSDVRPAGIDRVIARVNNGTAVRATIDALGNWSVPVRLAAGYNEIAAVVIATDGTRARATVKVCVEAGPVSGTVHGLEGSLGPLGPTVHDVDCSTVAPLEDQLLGGL